MSDTQVLLRKIAALRQRLEQAHGLVDEAGSAAVSLAEEKAPERVRSLERQVATASRHHALLDGSLRQLRRANPVEDEACPLPTQLTARARRLLQNGQDLLNQLRSLAAEPYLASAFDRALAEPASSKLDPCEEPDPLAARFRQTVAMTDVALRTVQAFPDAASAQLRLCEGLEGTLAEIAHRLAAITAVVESRRREATVVNTLAELLLDLSSGKALGIRSFMPLAEQIVEEAPSTPLRFLAGPAAEPARFVACHSLTVAGVIARVAHHDPDYRNRPTEPVLAALVHDAGMLKVPAAILSRTGRLEDDHRRQIEGHVRAGADMARRLLPNGIWLTEAVAGHHERLDGTGYPAGLKDTQIAPLTRLLAVCDLYAALCAARPQRPARETRTALTDTLLLAEKGVLDRYHAERLLLLGFYPVGSVVELADGSIGVVVATPTGRRDLHSPARPVVALLTDEQGRPLPISRHLDLAQCEGHSIVRSLPLSERREVLGNRYPELW